MSQRTGLQRVLCVLICLAPQKLNPPGLYGTEIWVSVSLRSVSLIVRKNAICHRARAGGPRRIKGCAGAPMVDQSNHFSQFQIAPKGKLIERTGFYEPTQGLLLLPALPENDDPSFEEILQSFDPKIILVASKTRFSLIRSWVKQKSHRHRRWLFLKNTESPWGLGDFGPEIKFYKDGTPYPNPVRRVRSKQHPYKY